MQILIDKLVHRIKRRIGFQQPIVTRELSSLRKYDIGEYTYGMPRVYSWNENATLRIGKFCSIADGVTILLGGEHRTDWVTTYPFNLIFDEARYIPGHPQSKGDVVIGNDVWIGKDAFILSGITIGDGAVIAARSVITRSVEPYSIVGGNPARLIRYRFSPEQIQSLQKIAWWEWQREKIIRLLPLMLSNQIDEFISSAQIDFE